MIQQETRLKVADNTGAKEILCIVLWAALQEDMQTSVILSLLRVKDATPGGVVKKGATLLKLLLLELKKALVVKTDLTSVSMRMLP